MLQILTQSINIYKTQQTKSPLTAPKLPNQWQWVYFIGCGDQKLAALQTTHSK